MSDQYRFHINGEWVSTEEFDRIVNEFTTYQEKRVDDLEDMVNKIKGIESGRRK